MKENIITINKKGEWNGYVELYFYDKLWYRGNYKNGSSVGYEEVYKLFYGSIGFEGTEVKFNITW